MGSIFQQLTRPHRKSKPGRPIPRHQKIQKKNKRVPHPIFLGSIAEKLQRLASSALQVPENAFLFPGQAQSWGRAMTAATSTTTWAAIFDPLCGRAIQDATCRSPSTSLRPGRDPPRRARATMAAAPPPPPCGETTCSHSAGSPTIKNLVGQPSAPRGVL